MYRMKIQKKIAATAGLLVLLAGMCGCHVGKTSVIFTKELGSNEVFQIGDTVCTLPEAKVYLCNYQNIYGSAYGIDLWKHETGSQSLEQYVKDITISQLARIVCMDELAAQNEIVLSEEEKSQAQDAAKAYYTSLTEDERLYMDISQDQLREMYEDYALAQKLYLSLTTDINAEVSDDEARIMEAQQIYVTDKEQADKVKQALKEGKDFLSVAADYNQAGKIAITFGRGELPKEVEDAAFNIEDEEITDCIAAGNGYYFIKCINKFNQELTDEHKLTIVKKREAAAFDDTYDQFVKEHDSVLNKELWKEVRVGQEEKIKTDSFFEVYDEYFPKR